uniref:Uncharacterized protein n=1 Tax=Glossina brevipalpis TaxID=37001 RepID=A0A1A9WES1_9MUSC
MDGDTSINLQKQLLNLQSQLMDCSFNSTQDTNNDNKIENDYLESTEPLWCIDDDGLFCAQGLVNHSRGHKSSVFVVWDDNYILNFVFKTSSKTQKTTLTNVRIPLPYCNGDIEEIQQMLILDFNTLLLMKSGRVYYFSSIKLIHQLNYLEGVRCMCMTSTKSKEFSVIRLQIGGGTKQLCLQVFQDTSELGNATYPEEFLLRSYDISFDERNLFDCNWEDEHYSLITLIVNNENKEFLSKLFEIGRYFLDGNEQEINLTIQQELHIFTISGNVLILAGAILDEVADTPLVAKVIENHQIHLLNIYASNVECVKIDCAQQFLIVLLQCGYIDVWYKSNQQFKGTFQLKTIQITTFTHYDFCSSNTTFYFVTPDQISEIKISMNKHWQEGKEECLIQEKYKAISGMMACTWAEHLKQLVCISYNNIFYCLTFPEDDHTKYSEDTTQHDNLQELYALTKDDVQKLLKKAHIINELMEQPSLLHQQIEKEYQKQVSIAMGSKTELLKKYYKAYIEYCNCLPALESYPNDTALIKIKLKKNQRSRDAITYYALIYFKLDKQDESILSAFTGTNWYLQLYNENQSVYLFLPGEMLKRNLCLLVECKAQKDKKSLANFQVKLFTFILHASNYLSVNFVIDLEENEKSFQNIFSHKAYLLNLWSPSTKLNEMFQKNFKNKEEIIPATPVENVTCSFSFQNNDDVEKVFENLKLKVNGLENDVKLYYLGHYLIVLNYNNTSKIVSITSQFPEALYYLKQYFLLIIKTNSDLQCTTSACLESKQAQIMQYQSNIERLYGFLTEADLSNTEKDANSIHLENLKKVYTKMREDLHEMFI